MAKKTAKAKRDIEQYTHKDHDRVNNPPVGLVSSHTDNEVREKTYSYDPHLDPQLQWAGKKERTSFDVPTVSLHVHERIDPKGIVEHVRTKTQFEQYPLFGDFYSSLPLREAVEFYKHKQGWSNRLIAGDSLLIMNSLLEKEGMSGQVQMIYFDPPYGIKYGSNFQPFVNKRDVKDGKDEDLTSEPEMIKAFRDTWELGIHSYLSYLRDRLLLAKDLLSESGSVFVQISDDNLHHIREILDEVFGSENYLSTISFTKAAGGLESTKRVSTRLDYIVWYAKSKEKNKYKPLFVKHADPFKSGFSMIELPNKEKRPLTRAEKEGTEQVPEGAKYFRSVSMTKPGPGSKYEINLNGKVFTSGNRWWGSPKATIENVIRKGRTIVAGNSIRFINYFDDFPYKVISNLWDGYGGASDPIYVVQTNKEIIQRCLLMVTDPGDLVLDITCGSGTTAVVAENWGRRWITCDTSRVAIALAKQRILTSFYEYYILKDGENISSGFVYKQVARVTLSSIGNNEPPPVETLYDQPKIDKTKIRISGPFTVEAVPAPVARSLEDIENEAAANDVSITRSGETLRQNEWRDELLRTGIRGKNGQYIKFSRVEPVSGTRFIQAEAETLPVDDLSAQKVLITFGPEFAPLEQRMVELAIDEASTIKPKAEMLLFVAIQFDAEAAKDIDETNWPGMTLLKVQMNPDLFTDDLKKKRSSNDSFWLIGQPDVQVNQIKKGDDKGKFVVEVAGFDYYNPKDGNVVSGGGDKIAMWMLDTNYDGRSLFPSQVFFPMSGATEGWNKLAKNLKAEIDEEKIESFSGLTSIPFEIGSNRQIAVKIIDDRGIESLKIIKL